MRFFFQRLLSINLLFLLLGCSSIHKEEPTMFHPPNQYHAIIRIYTDDVFTCTGFVVSDSYAITAAHCVNEGLFMPNIISEVGIGNSIGDFITRAKVVGANVREDYALLRGNFKSFRKLAVDFGGRVTFKAKEYLSCGYPSNSSNLVCATSQKVGTRYFQLESQGELIFPGHSGGPVFDKESNLVIGLNSAVSEDGLLTTPLTTFLAHFGLDKPYRK